jgi:hypothetical protein
MPGTCIPVAACANAGRRRSTANPGRWKSLAQLAPLLPGIDEYALADMDDSIVEVHGYAMRGAGFDHRAGPCRSQGLGHGSPAVEIVRRKCCLAGPGL